MERPIKENYGSPPSIISAKMYSNDMDKYADHLESQYKLISVDVTRLAKDADQWASISEHLKSELKAEKEKNAELYNNLKRWQLAFNERVSMNVNPDHKEWFVETTQRMLQAIKNAE